MKKSAPSRNIRKTQMESDLTEPEMDAALQLIQLSGDSAETGGGAAKTVEQNPEESVGDSHEISSNMKIRELEALPRRKKRFRLIEDVYSVTRPVIKKRGKKSMNWWKCPYQFCIYSKNWEKKRRRTKKINNNNIFFFSIGRLLFLHWVSRNKMIKVFDGTKYLCSP